MPSLCSSSAFRNTGLCLSETHFPPSLAWPAPSLKFSWTVLLCRASHTRARWLVTGQTGEPWPCRSQHGLPADSA